MSSQTPLNPTYQGHVATTWDALLLFEACLQGLINHVPRRPHDRERQELISSGNIFIYEEHASGIKRWTDGISWSPSRILGNFLIYRELDKPFPPGEKKRALKRKRGSQGVNKANPRNNSTTVLDAATIARDPERSLVGSLVDSYLFKEKGLVKKTISITYQGVPHHLVSYYSIDDVNGQNSLMTPSESEFFSSLKPRSELVMSQNFRNPVDEMPIYSQDDGYLSANNQAYYALGHVPDYSTHTHVADYGAQVMMTQGIPVSGISVTQMPTYNSRLEYEYMPAQQPQPHDHFEAQVDAQAEAQRLAHHTHQLQYHDSLQHEQLHQQQQQLHQMRQHQLQRQQLQQQMQMQMQQQQFQHHQLQHPQPSEPQQNQLTPPHQHTPQLPPLQHEESQQLQQSTEEYSDWASYGPGGYYYANGH